MSFKSLMQSLMGLVVPRNSIGGVGNVYGIRATALGIGNTVPAQTLVSIVPFVSTSDCLCVVSWQRDDTQTPAWINIRVNNKTELLVSNSFGTFYRNFVLLRKGDTLDIGGTSNASVRQLEISPIVT